MELTHTLDFQLGMREGDSPLLRDGTLESRRVVNEVFCFDKEGWDWSDIDGAVVDRSDHVQNTTQRLVAKATTALREYDSDEDHDYGRLNNTVRELFLIRMNHQVGCDRLRPKPGCMSTVRRSRVSRLQTWEHQDRPIP